METLFRALGLAPESGSLYLELVRAGTCPTGDVDEVALKELERSGLAQIDESGRARACPPRAATEAWAAHRELEVMRARTAAEALTRVYRERDPQVGQKIEWVTGRDRVRELFRTLFDRSREQIRGFDRGPYNHRSERLDPTQAEAHERGVVVRTIYEPEVLQDPTKITNVRECAAAGEQARVFTGLPLKLALSDDDLALITLPAPRDVDQVGLVVYPSALLDALSDVFESFWRMSVPFDAHAVEPPTSSETLTDETRRLLQLLAAGLSDKAIARDLHVSERTLHRRLASLQSRLGVRSRFQIGVQAAHRGWV